MHITRTNKCVWQSNQLCCINQGYSTLSTLAPGFIRVQLRLCCCDMHTTCSVLIPLEQGGNLHWQALICASVGKHSCQDHIDGSLLLFLFSESRGTQRHIIHRGRMTPTSKVQVSGDLKYMLGESQVQTVALWVERPD